MKDQKQHSSLGETTAEAITRSEKFLDENKKAIVFVIIAAVALVGLILGYKYLYKQPHEKNAEKSIFVAENYFAKDSFQLALNGNGADIMGFLDVIKKYDDTPTGNVAHAYAGICYYKLGDYAKAEEHLKKFDSSDTMVAPALVGLIGDCYVEQDKYQEAIGYFEKAAKSADNELISPIYLKKAATVYKHLGQNDKALECYKTIKEKYYASQDAQDIDKYIEQLSF